MKTKMKMLVLVLVLVLLRKMKMLACCLLVASKKLKYVAQVSILRGHTGAQ